jgi:hypothetical protein
MSKIVGNTTATPVPRSNWEQTDKNKIDYIRNKPTLGVISEKDVIAKDDLTTDVQSSLEEIETKANVVTLTTKEYEALTPEETNTNTLYMITDSEEEVSGKVVYVTVTKNDDGTYTADKTYDELLQSYNDGCALMCKHNTFVSPLLNSAVDALWFASVNNNIQNVILFHHDGCIDVHYDHVSTNVQIITWEADD